MKQDIRRVYQYLRDKGDDGATREGISAALNIVQPAVFRAVTELMARGLVEESGEYRRRRSGRSSAVLVVSTLRGGTAGT